LGLSAAVLTTKQRGVCRSNPSPQLGTLQASSRGHFHSEIKLQGAQNEAQLSVRVVVVHLMTPKWLQASWLRIRVPTFRNYRTRGRRVRGEAAHLVKKHGMGKRH